MIEQFQEFKGKKDDWELYFQLRDNIVYLSIHSQQSMQTFQAEMTPQKIQEDKNFSYFFEDTKEFYKFLEISYHDLLIAKDGCISFIMKVPLGRMVKDKEFRIPTKKKEINQRTIIERRMKNIEKSVDQLKSENQELRLKSQFQQQTIKKLTQQMIQLQRSLSQKDQVLNNLFFQINEINKWKEEKQKVFSQNFKLKKIFIADQMNSHNIKFTSIGSKFKKNCGGSWDVLICKHQIEKNDQYRYSIKQIKAGNNGSFMYGIGTAAIRGINRAQDHKQFIGYYQNTGNVYDRGESKKGGAKIKDGDIINIEIDTRTWKICWHIQGKKQAQIVINGQLRIKSIFLAIVVYNEESEIQFL